MGETLFRKKLKASLPLYLLALPSVILLLIFAYVPMGGIVLAFKDYLPALGIFESQWVGLKHFKQFFNSYQFPITIKNTVKISVYSILVGFPLPIILALMVNQMRNGRFKQVFQVITYLPHFISIMVMCGMIIMFLSPSSGLLANILAKFDVKLPNLLSSPNRFADIYVWSDVWQHIGWDSIIYLAALTGIDPTYYEAATMDGAGKFKKILHIDIPLLLPTAMIMLVLRMGGLLNVGFEKAFLLQNTMNMAGSEIISTYVYKIGMQSMQYSLSTAIGLFNTVINLMLLIGANWFSKKTTESGLF
ncbi:sugar ABC transporter permease [Tuanshanicoccus lijuaniae]|uniref:ABC transporter permease n=1 Tax=Aerococcaceae bacterium zg-1292 TaxID=2774330 RepID=UPI001938E9B5|nr:sugar ABC transporter permease [Aerococcaceae bacterium zg-1292]MBS4456696.1 sugar ABC transporter permease [Aerococcaceae bacterium zg-A91]MBS4458488.1 sugar ABC transporter permease [Aerococcaceae bacterium zg-BR33]QQA36528.1 sugar ABC transporter permease [Aerococcaceae bacterium zg-1292]